jgi:diadenosine tetraphosphatase ApaH/serine/threonine PP2A family protein phosphatase
LNPGSVGQPRDGDPRSSFVIINDGQVEFHRCAYDINQMLESMQAQEFPAWSIRLQQEILNSGGSLSKEAMDAIV